MAWIDESGEKSKLRFVPGWDAGHFVSRGYKVIRFDEENVNCQCSLRCNRLRSGEYQKYRIALDLKYGDGTAAKLEQRIKDTPLYTFKKAELLEIIQDCKTQISFYIGQAQA